MLTYNYPVYLQKDLVDAGQLKLVEQPIEW